jgi:WhiB family transcriptional regulator, redox-sensing transcriptional regulator
VTVPGNTAWMSNAKCRGVDVDIFFPGRGDNVAREEAKAFCQGCPVIGECYRYAMAASPLPVGVWGGTSTKERERIRAGKLPVPAWAA